MTRQRRSGVFIVNFEHFSLLSNICIFDFKQVFVCWITVAEVSIRYRKKKQYERNRKYLY